MNLPGARGDLLDTMRDAGLSATTYPDGREPPFVLIVATGFPEPTRVVMGQIEGSFACRIVAGAWDLDITIGQMDAMKVAVLAALRARAGWRMGDVGPDVIRRITGGDVLTADVNASRLIEI